MEGRIFIIISVLFITGVFFVWKIISKKPEVKKNLLTKYFTYLLIVYGTSLVFVLVPQTHLIVFGSILMSAAAIEVLGAWRKSGQNGIAFISLTLLFFVCIAAALFYSLDQQSGLRHLEIYAIVLCFDGFSQLCGQVFGKRKLLPSISPNKTIEGFAGGLAAAFITGVFVIKGMTILSTLIFVLVIILSSFAGDAAASLYKRKCGVKDYSNLIPGHGGVLDRFDSFIFAEAASLAFLI